MVSKLPVPLVTEERVFVAEANVSELAKTKSKSPVKRVAWIRGGKVDEAGQGMVLEKPFVN
jgi:hypothetical protein